MLKTIRGALSGVTGWLIMALVILAFAFVGVEALSNFRPSDAVVVGETRYSIRDVNREMGRRIRSFGRETGQFLSERDAIEAGMLNDVISSFAAQGLIEEEANALGLTATPDMLGRFLSLQLEQAGVESSPSIAQIADANDMTIDELRDSLRTDVLNAQLSSSLQVPLQAPMGVTELITLRQTEERTVRLATLSAPTAEDASDEELQSYFAANVANYQTDEYRTYTYIALNKDTLASRLVIDEAELQQLFASRQASLGSPERRSFAQAQFSDVATANAVIEAVRAGASFDAAATDAGGRAVSFASQGQNELADDTVADAIFAGAAGDLVGPIDGAFGIVIAQITDIEAGVTVDLDEVREELEADLLDDIYRAEVDELIDIIQDEGDIGASLEEAADAAGLTVETIGPVSLALLTPEGETVTGVSPETQRAVFEMVPNALFEEVYLGDRGYAFIELQAVSPRATLPFDEVADRVRNDYAATQTLAGLNAEIAAFQAAIAGGSTFEIAATTMGGTSRVETISALDASRVGPDVLQVVFEADIGEVVSAIDPLSETVTMAQVNDVTFGPNGQVALIMEQLRTQIGTTYAADLYAAYETSLRNVHEIRQNDRVLNTYANDAE